MEKSPCPSCGAPLEAGTTCPTCKPPAQASERDLEHLKILSIFHYVMAGITALFCSFPLFHVTIGILIVTGRIENKPRSSEGEAVGWVFIIIGSIAVLAGWALAALLVMAGRSISRRRRHLFCLIIAGLCCLNMPFGTVLGVFTFIVLLRPPVRKLFEASSAPA